MTDSKGLTCGTTTAVAAGTVVGVRMLSLAVFAEFFAAIFSG